MFNTFMKLLPLIVAMMGIAEKAFSGKPKSGAEKKAMVLAATKTTVDAITDVAGKDYNDLDKPISDFIDVSAGLLFKKENKESQAFPHPRLDLGK